MVARVRAAWLVIGAVVSLLGCTSSAPIPPTYTQAELKADCERRRGWWQPDDLIGGYCDFRAP